MHLAGTVSLRMLQLGFSMLFCLYLAVAPSAHAVADTILANNEVLQWLLGFTEIVFL